MIKKIIYLSFVWSLLFAFMACNKKCDRDNPELCPDFITVNDTVYTQNQYPCKKIKTFVSHEFTVCETDQTSADFGQPVATLSYDEVRLQAAFGCVLPIDYQLDCLGAQNLKMKNLCNKKIKIALIMGQENFNLWANPFETILGGSEQNGYCTGQKRIFILSVEKY